jgi:hypothetical protein
MGPAFIRYATAGWKRLIRVVYLSIEHEAVSGTRIGLFLTLDLDPQAGKTSCTSRYRTLARAWWGPS